LREALAHAHYRPVARAAELAAHGLCFALEAVLQEAFRRFAAQDHKRDPGCIAKAALARALLALAPDGSPGFFARWLDPLGAGSHQRDQPSFGPGPELAELAALALGESRLDAAVALLRARFEAEPLRRSRDRVLLRAAAMARTDAAFDWLLELAAAGDAATATAAVEELAAYRHHRRLRDELAARLRARGDAPPLAAFRAHFAADADPEAGT
jgi:hypothetical protein